MSDYITQKYDLYSEGLRDGHQGAKMRAKFTPWMEYRMAYEQGVEERKEYLAEQKLEKEKAQTQTKIGQ